MKYIIRDCGGNWLRFDGGGVYATTKANATRFTDWAVACGEWRKVRPTGSCEIMEVTDAAPAFSPASCWALDTGQTAIPAE